MVTIFVHKIWITLASISYDYVSIVVYIRSASDTGIGGGLKSHKTRLNPPHFCVPVPSQEPLSLVVFVE